MKARRQARRALARHGIAKMRLGALALLAAPALAARAMRGFYILPRIPGPVPAIAIPNTRLVTAPGPRHPVPPPAPTPAPEPAKPTTNPEVPVSAPIQAVSESFAAIAQFTPQNVGELNDFLASLSEMYESQARALQTLGSRFSDELPLAAPVAETIQEMASATASITDHAESAHATFRAAHADEIARLENPRTNEQFWDISQQG